MITITGANGGLGSATLSFLMKKTLPKNIVAIVRDAGKLSEHAGSGIHIRTADYEDQASLNQLRSQSYDKLSDIAFEQECADQSHFIRNFKEFTGLTPFQFRKSIQETVGELPGAGSIVGHKKWALKSGTHFHYHNNNLLFNDLFRQDFLIGNHAENIDSRC